MPDDFERIKYFLSDDQIVTTLKLFSPVTLAQRLAVIGTLAGILENYWMERLVIGDLPDLESHRQRLGSLLSAVTKLKSLIAREPTITKLALFAESGEQYGWTYDRATKSLQYGQGPKSAASMSGFERALTRLEENTSWMLDGSDSLRFYRQTPTEGEHLSLERRKLWEPVILLWYDCGKKVGSSRTGPVNRILVILHEALGLGTPNPESVFRTIQDFKGFVEINGRPRGSAESIYPTAVEPGSSRIIYRSRKTGRARLGRG
jgi:hypothetical protein